MSTMIVSAETLVVACNDPLTYNIKLYSFTSVMVEFNWGTCRTYELIVRRYATPRTSQCFTYSVLYFLLVCCSSAARYSQVL